MSESEGWPPKLCNLRVHACANTRVPSISTNVRTEASTLTTQIARREKNEFSFYKEGGLNWSQLTGGRASQGDGGKARYHARVIKSMSPPGRASPAAATALGVCATGDISRRRTGSLELRHDAVRGDVTRASPPPPRCAGGVPPRGFAVSSAAPRDLGPSNGVAPRYGRRTAELRERGRLRAAIETVACAVLQFGESATRERGCRCPFPQSRFPPAPSLPPLPPPRHPHPRPRNPFLSPPAARRLSGFDGRPPVITARPPARPPK